MKEADQKGRKLSQDFLRKNLNEKDAEAFRQRMQDDAFQEAVSEEVVRQYGRQQLKIKLDDIHEVVMAEQKRRRRFRVVLIIALAILLTAVGWYFISHQSKTSSTELYAAYFEPYPNVFQQKGEASSQEQDFLKAMAAYDEQNYAQAVDLLGQQWNQRPEKSSLAFFYYGISLLANNQSAKAKSVFVTLKEFPNALVPKEPLSWYLALAYLSEDQPMDARPLLEALAAQDKNKFKQKESAALLRQL